jgi:hypothetical protein
MMGGHLGTSCSCRPIAIVRLASLASCVPGSYNVDLKSASSLQVYNIYETVLSGFMGAAFAWESFGKGKYSWHSPVDRENGAFLAFIVW